MYRGARAWLGLSAAFVACSGGAASPGGGPRAFDVTASLTLIPPKGQELLWRSFPATHAFTLSFEPTVQNVIVAAGSTGGVSTTMSEGGTTRTLDAVGVGVPFAEGCDGRGTVDYAELTFSIDGDKLSGNARGSATFLVSGNVLQTADLSSAFSGVPDLTPPRLEAPKVVVSPMTPFFLAASEPLGARSTGSLVGASGEVVPLVRPMGSDPQKLFHGFLKPDVMLRYGETYTVEGELVDLAGNSNVAANPPTFTTSPAPPLVPEDGFESVTTRTLGGAGVLAGGPLSPIAGAMSLILNTGVGGGFGFLPYMLGPSVALRLAVAPGETVVRFSARMVATSPVDEAVFHGDVRVGSVGGAVTTQTNVVARDLVKVTLPVDGDVYVGPVTAIEIPLPSGAAGEVTFEIVGEGAGCGPPPPSTALVIDDLRVE